MPMKAEQVKAVRRALSIAAGMQVSAAELGEALGLSPKTANRKVREWEAVGPTGPAGVALTYLAQGLSDKMPEYVLGRDDADGDDVFIIRLRWPRFVLTIPEDDESHAYVLQWIDDAEAIGEHLPEYYVARAIEWAMENSEIKT